MAPLAPPQLTSKANFDIRSTIIVAFDDRSVTEAANFARRVAILYRKNLLYAFINNFIQSKYVENSIRYN
jgi:Flp pilus assembly CpaE family ATPase